MPQNRKTIKNRAHGAAVKGKRHKPTELQEQQNRASQKPVITTGIFTVVVAAINVFGPAVMHDIYPAKSETVNSIVSQPKSCEK